LAAVSRRDDAPSSTLDERNADFAVLDEQERLRVTLASIGDGVITADGGGRISYLNAVAEQLTGWTLAEAQGEELSRVFRIVHESSREPVANPAMDSLREGRSIGLANHTVLIAKDGTERPIDDKAAPIRDASGRIYGTVLVFRDITERKRAESFRSTRMAVIEALGAAATIEEGAAGVLRAICTGLNWDVGFFWRIASSGESLYCAASERLPDASVETFETESCGRRFQAGQGLPGRIWQSQQPAWILDISRDDNFPRLGSALHHGLHSAFGHPVTLGPKVVGVIEFFTTRIRQTDPDLLELIGTIAGVLGQFIQRKTAEEQLRQSELELADFFDTATIGLHWVGPDGTILRVNDAELQMLGYEREQYVGRPIADFHVDEAVIRDILARMQAGEKLVDYPARLRCHDGSIRHVLIDSSAMFREGQFVHTRCFTRDVTRQVESQRAAENANRLFRAAFNQQFQFMAIVAPDGRVQEANETCFRATGFKREQVIGKFLWDAPWWESLPDTQTGWKGLVHLAASGNGPATGELAYVLADGTRRHAMAILTGVKNEEGAVTDIVVEGRDDTERQRSEAVLAAQKHALELLVHGAPLPDVLDAICEVVEDQSPGSPIASILLVDEDGQHLRSVAGRHVPEEYARAVDGVEIASSAGSCGTAAFRQQQVIVSDIATDPLWAGFSHLALSHGLRACWSTPIFSSQQKVLGTFAVYYRTPRCPTPEELRLVEILTRTAGVAIERRRGEQALRDADRRKDEFLAMLAHELRNPLAPIRNGLQLLRMMGSGEKECIAARVMMERQLSQLVRLVDDLLDVSRITRNKLRLRREPVELATIVQSAVETSAPLIEENGHALSVVLPEEPIVLDADATRLAQVFSNLLNNSAKYTDRGGRIALSAEYAEGEAVVRVSDNGIGLAPEALSRVFEMFSQLDLDMNRAQGGLGIGLTLVRRLVEMHGGTVTAHSEGVGRGTMFSVRLPRMSVALPSTPPIRPENDSRQAQSRRVLVVDDNADSAKTLGMMLKVMGQQIHIVHDGVSAIQAAEDFQPDLVFLDIGLPEVNGYEACRRIRQQPWSGDMVIVALTGWGQEEDRRRSEEAGFDHHLVKPIEIDMLRRLLGESRPAVSDGRVLS
jgi:PAS domain S-box-containing protein